MKPITSESVNENHIRQWIKELTDYSPQQINKVVEQLKESYEPA